MPLGSFTCLPNTYRSGVYLAKLNIINMIMCEFIIIAFYDVANDPKVSQANNKKI